MAVETWELLYQVTATWTDMQRDMLIISYILKYFIVRGWKAFNFLSTNLCDF